MAVIKLNISQDEPSSFNIYDDDGQEGKMVFDVKDHLLTVYHTEVASQRRGMGYSKLLLEALADYARKNKLKVIPRCAYVLGQFKNHQKLYQDIWKQ